MAERSKITQLPGYMEWVCAVPAATITEAKSKIVYINNTGATQILVGASFIPDTAIAGTVTNYTSIRITDLNTTGTGTKTMTAIKNFSNTANSLTVAQPFAFTLSTTAASLQLTAGQVVGFTKTIAASGMVLPAGLVSLRFRFA
jgi:hypothetical protein